MTSYTNKLEDTVWCNDRSVERYNGWSETGSWEDGSDYIESSLLFGAHGRSNYASSTSTVKNQPSLTCSQENDRFTVSSNNGNGALTYPVAMLTADEIMLAGNSGNNDGNNSFYLFNYYAVWSLSPSSFYSNADGGHADAFRLYGSLFDFSDSVDLIGGLRPAVSLKLGTEIVNNGADGTAANPYRVNQKKVSGSTHHESGL